MSANQSIRVGAFFLLGIGLLWIVYETLSDHRFDSGNGYHITASFEDIQQLKASSEVRMAGVVIGTVVSTGLDGTRASVDMLIDKRYAIPANSQATVATAGMLGLNYVAIKPGNAESPLAADATIATVQTPDIGSVMAKLDGVGDRLDTVLANAQTISANIAEGKGTVGKLINDPAAYDELMATVKDIQNAVARASSFIDNTNEVVAHVKTGEGVLGTLIYNQGAADNLKNTFGNINEVIAHVKSGEGVLGALVYDQSTANNLKVTVGNVREFSTRLNNPNSSLGMFLDSDSLYRQASNTLTKLDGALNSMNDAGPITAVGVLGSALF